MSSFGFPASFFVHTATVETYLGKTQAGGETWSAPVTGKAGWLDDDVQQHLGTTENQQTGNAAWFTDLADVDLYPLKSRVTCNGRQFEVLRVRRRSSGILNLPDHLEVELV